MEHRGYSRVLLIPGIHPAFQNSREEPLSGYIEDLHPVGQMLLQPEGYKVDLLLRVASAPKRLPSALHGKECTIWRPLSVPVAERTCMCLWNSVRAPRRR